jgi:hypothetical protein
VVPRTDTNVWSSAYLVEVQTGAVLFLRFDDFDAEGRAQVRLPRGTYDINAVAGSDDPAHLSRPWLATLVSEPEVALSSDTSVTLDTRRGRPVSVSIDRPSAVRVEESLSITSIAPNGSGGTIGVGGGEQLQIFAVPSRAATGHSYIFEYNSILASSPLASAGSGDPFVYNLLFYDDGIPEQLAFRAPDSELAAVRTDYHVQAAPASGLRFDMAFTPGVPIAIALGFEVPLPGRRIEYFSAGRGIAWSHTLAVGDFPFGETTESFQEYRPGRSRTAWNRAPLGPAVAPYTGARRFGDYIRTDVSLFAGNQDGHVVWFAERPGISGTTSLSRDGVVIGSNDLPCVGAFAVPPSPGTYTLGCKVDRSVPWSALATRVEASWTLRDAGAAPEPRALPLLTVRIRGPVDFADTARAGQPFPLFLHVQRQPGSPASLVAGLALEASFDDGATWQPVPLVREPSGDRAAALLHHPSRDGFVSLRARASDAEGNTVDQTVVRAYRIMLAP